MTRDEALAMIEEYATICAKHADEDVVLDAAMMPDRWPVDGNESKAMRWLGYIQGVLVRDGVFTLEQVKDHSRRGRVRS